VEKTASHRGRPTVQVKTKLGDYARFMALAPVKAFAGRYRNAAGMLYCLNGDLSYTIPTCRTYGSYITSIFWASMDPTRRCSGPMALQPGELMRNRDAESLSGGYQIASKPNKERGIPAIYGCS
jgi:hypothetical protein